MAQTSKPGNGKNTPAKPSAPSARIARKEALQQAVGDTADKITRAPAGKKKSGA